MRGVSSGIMASQLLPYWCSVVCYMACTSYLHSATSYLQFPVPTCVFHTEWGKGPWDVIIHILHVHDCIVVLCMTATWQ